MKNSRTRYSIAILVVLVMTATIFVSNALALVESPTFLWAQVNQNGFGSRTVTQIFALEEFKGEIYAGASAIDGSIAVWKSPDGRSWSKIDRLTPAAIHADYDIMDLQTHNGYLYAATAWGYPAQLWRTSNGTSWEIITDPDFGNPANMFSVFLSVKDKLYVSDFRNIFVSTSGASNSWERVLSLDGKPSADGIWSMIEFNGHIYAGGQNPAGVEVYRLQEGGLWEMVNKPGFKNPPGNVNNIEIGGFTVFQNVLYTGTLNKKTGGEIWKTADGKNWSLVMEGGFGDVSNEKVEGFIVYNNQLVVAVNNPQNGLQIWSSPDGMKWTKIKDARYDAPLNRITHWNNSFLNHQDRLYLGTFNSISGAEIWSYPYYGLYLPVLLK